MNKINWAAIQKWIPETEVSIVAAQFVIHAHRLPIEMKIEIREYPDGKFKGFSDVSFWGPRQASPYESMHFTDTIESALIDLIGGMDGFQDTGDSQRYIFWVKEDPTDPRKSIYFDGTGTPVTLSELDKRRTEWHKIPLEKSAPENFTNGTPL